MRRKNREITDFNEITELLGRCQTIRLGMFDHEYPYVVPVSFGMEVKDGTGLSTSTERRQDRRYGCWMKIRESASKPISSIRSKKRKPGSQPDTKA